MIRLLAIIVLFCTGLTSAQDSTALGRIRQFFEWGEYDSIIAHAAPRCTASTLISPAEKAECFKYLGVACCARSVIGQGRAHFRSAFNLNNAVSLETYFVSPEIAGLFLSTIEECKKKVEADSLALVARVNAIRNQKILDSIAVDRRHRTAVTMAAVSFSLATLSGIFTVYEYMQTAKVYDEFKTAAAIGDKINYDRLKQPIAQGDLITVVSAIGTAIFAGFGAYTIVTLPLFPSSKITLTVLPLETGSSHGIIAYVRF